MTFKPLDFDSAIAEMFLIEGGKSSDAGGTNLGVTTETLNAYLDKHGITRYPVDKLTEQVAGTIYHEGWWVPLNVAQLRSDFGLALFLEAPNLPWHGAAKIMQGVLMRRGVYHGIIDGDVGALTIQATKDMPGTVEGFLDGCAAHYATNSSSGNQHGLIERRLTLVAQAIGRLEKEP